MKRIFILFILTVSVLSACSNGSVNNNYDDNIDNNINNFNDDNDDNDNNDNNDNNNNNNDNILEHDFFNISVEEILSVMTLEEKIGQLFITDLDSINNLSPVTTLDENLKKRLEGYKLGGYTLFSTNIQSIDQTEKLLKELRKTNWIPPFLCVDEEGGLVSRIGSNQSITNLKIPSASKIGKLKEVDIYNVSIILSKRVKSLGFNTNFAPVCDINTNSSNPVIGTRAYSDNHKDVSLAIKNVILAFKDTGIFSVAKHFPGHGDTFTDSHLGYSFVEHDLNRINEIELRPFIEAIENDVDMIMTGHIALPKVTGDNIPATLNSKIINDILRKQLGYNGVVITDAMNMGAIIDEYGKKEAVEMAFLAGVDIILIPIDIEDAIDTIIALYNEGIIDMERINDSVRRILTLKKKT